MRRTFEISKRLCRSSWFKTYKLLHYVTKNDAVISYICPNQEFSGNLRSERKEDPVCISKGYSNWKKVIEKFEDHQKTNSHKTAVSFEVTLPLCRDVHVIHDTQILKEQDLERRYFGVILETIQILGRQGVSFQGHNKNDNFTQFFLLCAKDDPNLQKHHVYSTFKRRGGVRIHVASTWN